MEWALVAALFVLVSWAAAWSLFSSACKEARDAENKLAEAREEIDRLTEELERFRGIAFKQWKETRSKERP